MRIENALKQIKAHKYLLGKSLNGANIDELLIVPTNVDSRQQFEKLYINCLDAQAAITPFVGEDVEIHAVFDKKRIRTQNIFLSTTLDNTLKMLEDEQGNII